MKKNTSLDRMILEHFNSNRESLFENTISSFVKEFFTDQKVELQKRVLNRIKRRFKRLFEVKEYAMSFNREIYWIDFDRITFIGSNNIFSSFPFREDWKNNS